VRKQSRTYLHVRTQTHAHAYMLTHSARHSRYATPICLLSCLAWSMLAQTGGTLAFVTALPETLLEHQLAQFFLTSAASTVAFLIMVMITVMMMMMMMMVMIMVIVMMIMVVIIMVMMMMMVVMIMVEIMMVEIMMVVVMMMMMMMMIDTVNIFCWLPAASGRRQC